MTQAPVGIIAAMPEEARHFPLADAVDRAAAGEPFRAGRLDGIPVVLAQSGIGKVNAALTATLLADRFGCRALIVSGVAGGLDPQLGIGDAVVATRMVQHDYGAVLEGGLRPYRPGTLPLPGHEGPLGFVPPLGLDGRAKAALAGLELPMISAAATGGAARRPAIHFGPIASGDGFVNCEATRARLHHEFGALAVEMEGGAVAQIAERFGLPWLAVRVLSDLAGAESHMDFGAFVAESAATAALVVRRLVPLL